MPSTGHNIIPDGGIERQGDPKICATVNFHGLLLPLIEALNRLNPLTFCGLVGLRGICKDGQVEEEALLPALDSKHWAG